MMKVYIYPPVDGQRRPGQADLLSGSFDCVSDPAWADWFYAPVDLGLVWWDSGTAHGDPKGGQYVRDFVQTLPFYQGHERRHFFHDYSACSDDWGLQSVLFRAVKSAHDPNPLTISIPHTVDDFQPKPVDFGTLPYDVCFVGRSGSCPSRRLACRAVADDGFIRSYLKFYDDFFGHLPEGTSEWTRRRQEFIDGLRLSKLVLSPRGVELDAYRTWEAMSAGRVAVWIGDDYELPFAEFVDYGDFMFQYPESDAPRMNENIKEILRTHTDEQLQAHGERARQIWLEWYRMEATPRVFAHYLKGLM